MSSKLIRAFFITLAFVASITPMYAGETKNQSGYFAADSARVLYESETLIIRKLGEHVYQHTTFLSTNSFGRVSCNGMVVADKKEAIVFDTPSSIADSEELIRYLTAHAGLKIKAIVATHFHADCLGGLEAFHKAGIPSYANQRTIQFAKAVNAAIPGNSFPEKLNLKAGNSKVETRYFGEGHTRDNVIAWVEGDHVLFGGCLVKELQATKGNLEDANTDAWSGTVTKIKSYYPDAKIVIPGHGKSGGADLLDYTIALFRK